MIETLSFRTQARTVDHLGREQIADCPTAISELWKNAYDAYARNVSLHIFDDPEPVAAIFDDGHGMSFEEFENRWLIVGTTSKFDKSVESKADRNGLPKRTKQGQKGIGRLSSANLGPLLLLVTKRKEHNFVAALIDWRIFENPYLVLSDIEVPVIKFKEPGQLFEFLPELFERLMDNLWGNPNDSKRTERLKLAWETFDRVSLEETPKNEKPSQVIANTIINAHFAEHQIEPWSVWSGESQHGTALLVSDINHDLRAQLGTIEPNSSIKSIREQFFATLSAFTDPFVEATANEKNAFDPQFSYEVITWTNRVPNSIIEDEQDAINRSITDEMEHVLSGNIDGDGVFHGHIKAFGEWQKLGTDYKIYPPKDFRIPKGPTTYIGPFSLHVATFELKRDNSTLSDADHSRFLALAEQHSGFLVFRNGLRVLPYGRTDNDFFQIETRRSISAGREFWNARRMFGRVAISRENNPNLKDKAGREGFIDNQSAKALRILVANILRRAAYEYFGQASELRRKILPDIQEKNAKAKAEIERKNLSKKNALKFRSRLKANLPKLIELTETTRNVISGFEINNQQDIERLQSLINDISAQLSDLHITGAPAKLGSSEDDYRTYRNSFSLVQDFVRELEDRRAIAIQAINPDKPEDIAQKQLNSFAGQLQAKLRNWKREIEAIQGTERERVKKLFEERTKVFHSLAMPLVEQVKMGKLELDSALKEMKKIQTILDIENEDTFQSYLDTLEIMSENINIELIASQGASENVALRDEINRLNEVAQLGVTVEIVGHELSSHERMIREGLRQVKSGGHEHGTRLIEEGFEALSEQLEFLAPLKVSGSRIRRKISGEEIFRYLEQFFHRVLRSRQIRINASDDFQKLSLYEQPSRILPVFINLVNNSVYWLVNSHIENPVIALSVINNKVVVSDNGPGIDQLDQESLFKIFFSRKSSRGRGIGLYLCRANLMAGGHVIEYATERSYRYLSGANFVIDFKGASFD
ncbi:histidine kinase [Pseudidiomarina aquimaris]|uniref:Histidine kinase n=1 Tax=Pseudidiomarina aquimaris TaxID=641841 RepID=A0A432XI17_9GAMM|nr:ATP-binding protein [Pseudidiomarina aquimaris]RUO48266.1 histidine kinase [Pseudidiomarina aquimaris]